MRESDGLEKYDNALTAHNDYCMFYSTIVPFTSCVDVMIMVQSLEERSTHTRLDSFVLNSINLNLTLFLPVEGDI